MQTIQKIIENQKEFSEQIMVFFSKERTKTKEILNKIKTNDQYINKEKNKLKNRLKKINPEKYLKKLFFMHPNRDKIFYVWWDEVDGEAKIFKYKNI